jgi:hypothetical protein
VPTDTPTPMPTATPTLMEKPFISLTYVPTDGP